QQEERRARPREPRRPRGAPRPGGQGGRVRDEPLARPHGAARPRLRGAGRGQPRPRLRLGPRVRGDGGGNRQERVPRRHSGAAVAPITGSAAGMGDHPTSMALFGAIMLALYQRERTGRGAKVSSSLLAGGAWANGLLIQAALCGAAFTPRRPREQALNPLANLYQCRDGRWFLLTLLREDRDWERLARAVGRPELLAD